jgi:hypothetical protein
MDAIKKSAVSARDGRLFNTNKGVNKITCTECNERLYIARFREYFTNYLACTIYSESYIRLVIERSQTFKHYFNIMFSCEK